MDLHGVLLLLDRFTTTVVRTFGRIYIVFLVLLCGFALNVFSVLDGFILFLVLLDGFTLAVFNLLNVFTLAVFSVLRGIYTGCF